ncbi:MAG: type III-B CRISPR-associated protein Cas10/Cmr2 [Pirellulales bacterium]
MDPDLVRHDHGEWSGQWLHWPRQDFDEDERSVPGPIWPMIRKARSHAKLGWPPAYFAVLVMDGDYMGRWLAGDNSPAVRDILHPRLREYFEGLDGAQAGLDARRPLGPARHAAISEALANFALHVVPSVVRRHHGTLVYAGGDDVLALLPCATALSCAWELRLAFSGDERVNGGAWPGYYRHGNRDLLMMGPTASTSAGLAIVHYKEDLRFAIQTARRAEKRAKDAGRDILLTAVCRRSGEHAAALCPWDFVAQIQHWVGAFKDGASDRWAYHLRGEMETLKGLPVEAMRAEIGRQVGRAEAGTRNKLLGPGDRSAREAVVTAFDRYRDAASGRGMDDAEVLRDFVILCQSASFLARGRGER